MKEEEENQDDEMTPDDVNMAEPEVKRFTDKDLVRVVSILFVFVVYFYIFLKIMFLS